MTLVERSQDIKSRLAYQGQLKESQELARQVQERTGTITKWRTAAATAHEQLIVLGEAGRTVPQVGGTIAVLACRRFAEKVESRSAVDGDWSVFKAVVEKQVDAVEGHAIEGTRQAQVQVRQLSIENLEAMAKIQGKEAEFARLRQEKAELERESWKNRQPEQLRKLLGRLSALLAGVEALSDLKAPPEVQSFLDKARRSEALVDDLTPKVKSWLDANGLLGRLRITLGGR